MGLLTLFLATFGGILRGGGGVAGGIFKLLSSNEGHIVIIRCY